MNREKIELDEESVNILYKEEGYTSDFDYLDEEITYTDFEKGLKEINVIIKRKKDGKLFKFSCTTNGYELSRWEKFPKIATEVFPKQVTTTIYE